MNYVKIILGLFPLILPLGAASADPFKENFDALIAGLAPLPDKSLEMALDTTGCRAVGSGDMGPSKVVIDGEEFVINKSRGHIAFAECSNGAEISLRTASNSTAMVKGRQFRTSTEIREQVRPDASGLSFYKMEKGTKINPNYTYYWRSRGGIQYQLTYYNAPNETEAKRFLKPIALELESKF